MRTLTLLVAVCSMAVAFLGCETQQGTSHPPDLPASMSDASGSGGSAYDPCEGKICGASCTACAPGDDDCVETAVVKACGPTGQCVADKENLCGGSTYDPCAGRACGDACTVCAPDDDGCIESPVVKACNPSGQCVPTASDLCPDPGGDADAGEMQDAGAATDAGEAPDTPLEDPGSSADTATDAGDAADAGETPDGGEGADGGEAPDTVEPADAGEAPDPGEEPDPGAEGDEGEAADAGEAPDPGEAPEDSGDETGYDPCDGVQCGDKCTLCAPEDPDCVETAVIKACDKDGNCVLDLPGICDGAGDGYDPCEGKQCGETCKLCAPDDTDCNETDVIKYCQADGSCKASAPACSQ